MEDKMDFLKRISANIRVVRKSQKLSQRELAELIGTKEYQVFKIESGRIASNIMTLKRVADALGIDVKQLL